MKKLIVFIILTTFISMHAQDCNDGILNGSETGIDCGGMYCPPCESETLPVLNQIITQRKLADFTSLFDISFAIDKGGNNYITAYSTFDGSYDTHVVTGNTVSGTTNIIYTFENDAVAPTIFMDITREGNLVLFTNGTDGIFVADWDGDNRRVVADVLDHPDPNWGNFEPFMYTTPKFSYDGNSIYLFHRGNDIVHGLWNVGLNEAIADNFLFNIADMEDEFGEIRSTGNHSFLDIQTPVTGEVFFLSSLHNEDVSLYEIYTFSERELKRIVEDKIWYEGYNISSNGENLFYALPNEAIVRRFNRNTDSYRDFDFSHISQGAVSQINSNEAGTMVMVRASEARGSNGGTGYFIFNSTGRHLYPINTLYSSANAPHDEVNNMIMSEIGDRLIFQNQLVRGSRSAWVADISEPIVLPNSWPRRTSIDLSQNWLLYERFGAPESLDIKLYAKDGIEEIIAITTTEESQKRGLYDYMNNSWPYSEGLSDDGTESGDDVADDNIWTNLGVYQTLGEPNVVLPEAFHIRFNLISQNYITSYIVGPMYVAEMAVSTEDEQMSNYKLSIYPSHTKDQVQIDLTEFPHSGEILIFNDLGSMIDKIQFESRESILLHVASYSNGLYHAVVRTENKKWSGNFWKI